MKNQLINKNLKKIIIVLILVVLLIGSIIFLVSLVTNKNKEPKPEPLEYLRVYYSIDENCCSIIGQHSQLIEKGSNSSPITIVPKLGYYFLGWVDVNNQDEYFDKDKFTRQEYSVQEDIYLIPKFQGPVNSHIVFRANKGGQVQGKLEQTVIYGGKGEQVTAIPDEGYRFVRWSDGETEAVRENQSVKHYGVDFADVYAEFERYSRKFEYVYNGGISKTGEKEIEINLDNIDEVTFPIPEREDCQFEGWYSDWHYEIQVADKNGKMQVGLEWLNKDKLYDYSSNPEGYLYAKWTTSKKLPTYKILMIYITEVHGDFTYRISPQENELVRVDYVMTDMQRRICNNITELMSKYLNAVFNETVRFEVDEYFTEEPLDEKVFFGDGQYFKPVVEATNGVIEVHDIIPNYDSVITTYSLCGYENNFKLTGGVGGSATAKYATVVIDDFLYGFNNEGSGYFGDDLENIFDNYYQNSFCLWEGRMYTYIHEFIHTVEMQVGIMDNVGLHASEKHYGDTYGALNPVPYNVDIPYLLNKYEAGEEVWGIPYEFWVNKDKERNQAINC